MWVSVVPKAVHVRPILLIQLASDGERREKGKRCTTHKNGGLGDAGGAPRPHRSRHSTSGCKRGREARRRDAPCKRREKNHPPTRRIGRGLRPRATTGRGESDGGWQRYHRLGLGRTAHRSRSAAPVTAAAVADAPAPNPVANAPAAAVHSPDPAPVTAAAPAPDAAAALTTDAAADSAADAGTHRRRQDDPRVQHRPLGRPCQVDKHRSGIGHDGGAAGAAKPGGPYGRPRRRATPAFAAAGTRPAALPPPCAAESAPLMQHAMRMRRPRGRAPTAVDATRKSRTQGQGLKLAIAARAFCQRRRVRALLCAHVIR